MRQGNGRYQGQSVTYIIETLASERLRHGIRDIFCQIHLLADGIHGIIYLINVTGGGGEVLKLRYRRKTRVELKKLTVTHGAA